MRRTVTMRVLEVFRGTVGLHGGGDHRRRGRRLRLRISERGAVSRLRVNRCRREAVDRHLFADEDARERLAGYYVLEPSAQPAVRGRTHLRQRPVTNRIRMLRRGSVEIRSRGIP